MKTSPHHLNLTTLLPLALVCCALGFAASATRASQPNILFILVDDYRIKDVGIESSTFCETPNIDALARSGMRFTQGYSACAVCRPSRASIMLGQYPTRHGITDWIGAGVGEVFARNRQTKLLVPDCVRNLPATSLTLPAALKKGSYTTFFGGK
jgi:arylsulfatase A-like enzyme